ncbi:MAG TPA: hypothetical protein VIZ65_08335 [Cellvibrionaceae bacterium]
MSKTENTTLKDVTRSILDVGSFVHLDTKASTSEGEITNDFKLGLFTLHRFTFYGDELMRGKSQEVIGLAPGETLEVVTESVRRLSREDEFESTEETSSERSTETKDVSEISDLVAKSLTETARTSTSLNAGANYQCVSGSFAQNNDVSSVSSASSEHTTKIVKETTVKAADRMKRSTRLRVRNVQELTEKNSVRRLIENKKDVPLNIIARTALRKETVIAQRIDLRLCIVKEMTAPSRLLRIGAIASTPLASNDRISSNYYELTAIHSENAGEYSWNASRGTTPEDYEITLPPDTEYNENEAPTITNFFIESWGPKGQAIATPNNWGSPDGIFVINIIKNEGTKVTLRIFMRIGLKDLNPHDFTRGATFRISIQIPVRKSIESMKKELGERAQLIRDRLSLAKRSIKDLRDEERFSVLMEIAEEFKHLGNNTLDLNAAWYEIPMSFDNNHADTTKEEETYEIPAADCPALPFGAGLKGNWGTSFDKFPWDSDTRRFQFINSDKINVFIPIVSEKEDEIITKLSLIKVDEIMEIKNYVSNRRKKLTELRDTNGDKLDPGDIAADTKTFNVEQWNENAKIFSGTEDDVKTIDDGAKSTKKDKISYTYRAEDFFPVVDRFTITTPVEGFLLETFE